MLQAYPVVLSADKNDAIIAEFPDVPEALTCGADETNALQWAQDALVVALSGYVDDRRDIPVPSKPQKGQRVVALPPMVAAKLAIYQAMRDQEVTQAEMASRLHCDARQVRRLVDLDHHSRLDQMEAALTVLGKRLRIDVVDESRALATGE
jgi:antitoxin HicB